MAGDEGREAINHDKTSAPSRVLEPWENPNHPLFLHHSDQPGAVLVSQTLMEDNYTTWSQSMNMALTIKNKKGFVDGSIQRPTTRIEEQQQWDRCNTLVKTWLLGSMSKEIFGSVVHCKNARDMWLELRCEKCNMTNHRTKNCRAHLKCNFCGGKGHSYDYCRRRKAAMEGEQGNSKGNHVTSMHDNRFDGNNFPFSQEECRELAELLSKNKATKVNHAGNVSNYEELSGPTIGGDDWDGN